MPSPLQKIIDTRLGSVQLFVKRDDLLWAKANCYVSGNKWRKLKYNLAAAREQQHHTILTFGGAYSNHIHATAAAASMYGLRSIGIIRGEAHTPLNPTLQFATEQEMTLHYISRSSYRDKYNPVFIEQLRAQFGRFYLLPEGGSNPLAVRGCAELVAEIEIPFDYLCAPCGTGGTLAGIIAGLTGNAKALGFAVLKGDFLHREVCQLLEQSAIDDPGNWCIDTWYHFGGYAKIRPALIEFIDDFQQRHDIVLDPIYTGKMMYAIYDYAAQGKFPPDSTVVALHTGGLQGIAGMRKKCCAMEKF